MNRRQFAQSVLATASLPLLPTASLAAAPTVAIPNAARYWATYMSQLHGCCTPKMLSTMLKINIGEATSIINELVRQGHLTTVQIVAPQVSMGAKTIANRAAKPIKTALQNLRAHMADFETAEQAAPHPW